MSRVLIWLSCPFGGKKENLLAASLWLAWAHSHTTWGLWVQAPWLASARADLSRGTTEDEWLASGGLKIEAAMMRMFGGLLHAGPGATPASCSPGQTREARRMSAWGGRIWQVSSQGALAPNPLATLPIVETTEYWLADGIRVDGEQS